MAEIYKENPLIKVVMLKGQDGEEKLINQADGSGVSFWIGTRAQYDAIPQEELIENCVYYITDDTRDDFRFDLNALDTKVDNNTTAISKLNDALFYKVGDTVRVQASQGGVKLSDRYLGLDFVFNKFLPANLSFTVDNVILDVFQGTNVEEFDASDGDFSINALNFGRGSGQKIRNYGELTMPNLTSQDINFANPFNLNVLVYLTITNEEV